MKYFHFLKKREGGRKRADKRVKKGLSVLLGLVKDGISLGHKRKHIEYNTTWHSLIAMLINKTKPKALILSPIKHLIWVSLSWVLGLLFGSVLMTYGNSCKFLLICVVN